MLKNKILVVLLFITLISSITISIADNQFTTPKPYCLPILKQEKIPEHLLAIGISIGGTNIRVGLVSGNGVLKGQPEVFEWRKGFGKEVTSETLVNGIMNKIEKVLQHVNDIDQVIKIGVAFAGPVDSEQGIVGTPFPAPNLPFKSYPLAKEIEKRYQMLMKTKYAKSQEPLIKVSVWNDSHASVLGEFNQEGGRGQHGMIFILGTGTNGAVVSDGVLYTDNKTLLELGFNLLKKEDKWVFTGKHMKGNKPTKEPGALYNIDLFSGEGIAKQFVQYKEAKQAISQFIVLPSGISSIQQLFDIIESDESDKGQIKKEAINALLVGITTAVAVDNPLARSFVKDIGSELGKSLAALVEVYYLEPWVEHIVLVGSIAEKFSKVSANDLQDIFIEAVRKGVSEHLKAKQQEGLAFNNERIALIAKGIERSNMDWKRELLAAKLTLNDMYHMCIGSPKMEAL
jgi:predicted NBD/HSP70 family sugar kinase